MDDESFAELHAIGLDMIALRLQLFNTHRRMSSSQVGNKLFLHVFVRCVCPSSNIWTYKLGSLLLNTPDFHGTLVAFRTERCKIRGIIQHCESSRTMQNPILRHSQ